MLPTNLFKNKHLLIGISGGIAAYKSAELVRYFIKQEAEVRVLMSRAAEKFIPRLTMETLSNNPVAMEMFPEENFSGTHHIHLADWADAAIFAPATYNFIGKLRAGIADDLISTIAAALHCPVVIAPAMNVNMWNNPILQQNMAHLENLGYLFCPPGEGFLAEGYSGIGRLAPLEHLAQYAYRALHPQQNQLRGKNVLITAGRTEEPIDPVRYLSNRSSGKMGFALAIEAFARGAEVSLIHGPTHLEIPTGIKAIQVGTAAEMFSQVGQYFESTDIYLSAAAVADYTPSQYSEQKVKKSDNDLNIALKRTTDILKFAGEQKKPHQILVGFALETESGEDNAREKLRRKNLDMVVLNSPLQENGGFRSDANQVSLIGKTGDPIALPLLPKLDVAQQIFDVLEKINK